ncbi:MAG: DUF1080 domain-containing protein [Planctomycetota bacterium]
MLRLICLVLVLMAAGCSTTAYVKKDDRSVALLDMELSQWEIWMGIPHETVEGLPEGTFQSDNVHKGEPMGLNKDVKNVFTMIEEDGEPVLAITGEIYGGLTTLDSFENYHFTTEFRWGDQKWEPRLNVKRDSGILYHCYGEHGSFWNVWKSCLEYQVQETDLGDFIPLAGPKAKMRGTWLNKKRLSYDPNSTEFHTASGYTSAFIEPDAPHGEWNTLEFYVIGNDAVHLANGEIVLVLHDAVDGNGDPLVRGQIQIQSEAAECYYRNMVVTPITMDDLPADVAAAFADGPPVMVEEVAAPASAE